MKKKFNLGLVDLSIDNIKKDKNREESIQALIRFHEDVIESHEDYKQIQKRARESLNILHFMELGKDDLEENFIEDLESSLNIIVSKSPYEFEIGNVEQIDIINNQYSEKNIQEDDGIDSGELEQADNEEIIDEEFLQSFIEEAYDLIEQTEPLIEMLVSSSDPENTNAIFRLFHTLKGLSGFFNLNEVNRLTHSTEQLLDKFRKNPGEQNEEDVALIYKVTDLLRLLVDEVESKQTDLGYEEEINMMLEELNERIELETKEVELVDKEDIKVFKNEGLDILNNCEQNLIDFEKTNDKEKLEELMRNLHNIKGNCGIVEANSAQKIFMLLEEITNKINSIDLDDKEELISKFLEIIDFLTGSFEKIDVENFSGNYFDAINREISDLFLKVLEENDELNKAFIDEINNLKNITKRKQKKLAKISKKASSVRKQKNIRISTDKLDNLFNLVGELITIKNMVVNHPDIIGVNSTNYDKAVTRLNKVVRELQDATMAIRMIPLTKTFNKMKRIVRDLSGKFGKKVDFIIQGADTEVDKNINEKVADPLVHIIRNSLDHGVETPQVRREKGKNEVGTVKLRAFYEGNEIVISIQDDGNGIDKESVLNKAIKKDILEKEPEEMNDEEIYKLIFHPGFSTAQQVTNVSGRGVGMDVVKKNIENELKGKVEVESTKDEGTHIKLRIPLTLAIMDAMIFRVGKLLYAISLKDVKESFQAKEEALIKDINCDEIVKVREDLIPIIRLHKQFKTTADNVKLTEGILLRVESRNKSACLFIDEIIDQKQIVVKPLPKMISHKKEFQGSMVLANGEVGMILDVANIIVKG